MEANLIILRKDRIMPRVINVQVTSQGALIPHSLVAEWTEVEVIKLERQLIVRPKHLPEQQEREAIVRALRQANLTSPLADSLSQQAAPVSPERRAELAQALAVGKPLSEIVIEERAERW